MLGCAATKPCPQLLAKTIALTVKVFALTVKVLAAIRDNATT
jgi:hypothetical protein